MAINASWATWQACLQGATPVTAGCISLGWAGAWPSGGGVAAAAGRGGGVAIRRGGAAAAGRARAAVRMRSPPLVLQPRQLGARSLLQRHLAQAQQGGLVLRAQLLLTQALF